MSAESDYEKARQENIAKNRLLLQQLQLDAGSLATSAVKRKRSATPQTSTSKRSPRVKKERVESPLPRRTSSRIKGIQPDTVAAQLKDNFESEALHAAERAKRQRVAGDLSFEITKGLLDGWSKWEDTFTAEDVRNTKDVGLREMREKMMGLKLLEDFDPTDIKICPERIYHLAFHPTPDKPLIFAGDKIGNLGIFNASSTKENDSGDAIPDISQFKLHTRTIATFQFDPDAPNALYSSSYDGSVRRFDLSTGVATEVFVAEDEDPLSGIEVVDTNTILFSTLNGVVGRRDLRSKNIETWQLSDKKIGGFSMHPKARHLIATASLDRTVKIWDLRKIEGKGDGRAPALKAEHSSRLSVSCALWNSAGTLATTSYDDTIKLYKFPNALSWAPEFDLGEIKPSVVIPHNNQTGRWVTILRAQWQQAPRVGGHKFVIANMNRSVDIFAESGERLAQLVDDRITAVPAVTQFHPTIDWVAGGTGSGKLALFM